VAKKKEKVQDTEHAMLITWVNETDDATSDARAMAERCRDYYDGKQWTAAEAKKLKAQKQAATVINRIKPKVDGLLGMEKTQRTTAKAFPRTPAHEQDAVAATEAIRFGLQDNFYEQLRSEAFEYMNVEGIGGMDVNVKDQGGDFKIVIKSIPWDRIIYDPHSRKRDFSDARYLGQVVWMDYDEAVDLYPEAKDILESMQEGSDTYGDKPRWMDNTRRRVKLVEMYYYKGRDVYYATFTHGGFVVPPKISPFKNEEGETEWCYEFASPFVDREGIRYGSVAQYLDVQDEINKRRSKALHLMSVRQIAVFKGALEDVNKTRSELAKPDGVVELTQPLNESFEVLKTGDMAAAQFNLLTEAKAEIDAVGYNAAVAGKDQKAISGIALKQRQMAGQTELAPLFDCLKHLDHRVYRKVWNRIRQYWTTEKWIRVTDDEQNQKWMPLNTPYQDKEGHTVQHNLAELDVDIVIDDAPDSVTTQIEDFQVLGEMVKSGFPIPPEAVILASPLSHKDRILKMMKERPQLPPEIQEKMAEMQEAMQKMAEENQQLKSDQAVEMQKLQLEAQKSQQEMSLEVQKTQAELQLEREKAQQELALEREKAAATLQLEREKAAGQVALESEKANAQISLENKKIDAQTDVQKRKAQADLKVKSIELGQNVEMEDPEEEARVEQERQQSDSARMTELMTNTIGNPLQGILQSLQALIQLQQQTLMAFERPRQVSLSGVKRDSAGHIVAAQVSPTLN
jgi:hypothetical protein